MKYNQGDIVLVKYIRFEKGYGPASENIMLNCKNIIAEVIDVTRDNKIDVLIRWPEYPYNGGMFYWDFDSDSDEIEPVYET